MKALESIWFGDFEPQKLSEIDAVKAKELANVVTSCYEKLVANLTDEMKVHLFDYVSSTGELECFVEQKAFERGFNLAVQLVFKALSE